jgi:peptidyl-prolyl cis-trans isomerase B (cyclophilin B)
MSNRVRQRTRLAQQARRADNAARRVRNRRLRLRATVAGAVVIAAAVVAIVLVTRPHHGTVAAPQQSYDVVPAGCRWIDLPTNGRSKEMTDVGQPPTGLPPSSGTATMTITTNLGVIRVKLDVAEAPCSVRSMAFLAGKKFFDNTPCHRLSTSYHTLTCGDPSGTGEGGATYRVYDENVPVNDRPAYPAGSITLANDGPNTQGSQFDLFYDDTYELEPTMPIIGQITEGLDIVKQVASAGQADNAFDTLPNGTDGPGGGHPKQQVKITSLTVSGP